MNNRILIGTFILIGALTRPAYAHPASNIALSVSEETLTISVTHTTKNPVEHFIDTVIVSRSDNEIITQKNTSQTTPQSLTISYVIPGLRAGDILDVKTHCNKGGNTTARLVVP